MSNARRRFAYVLATLLAVAALYGSYSRGVFADGSPVSYASGAEGEIWQQLPSFGRGVDSFEKPVSFTLPSSSDPTGNLWPCVVDASGSQIDCYPSGTVGVGIPVQPSDTQVYGDRFTPCVGSGASAQCYPSGRIGVGTAVPVSSAGPCAFTADIGVDCYPSGTIGLGARVPPATGHVAGPASITVDNTPNVGTIYVTDHYNNRVQAFDFSGNSFQLTHPIGNGTAGAGSYTQVLPGGATVTGELLNAPEGIKLDASRNILVSDSFNGRVAVFNTAGSLLDGSLVIPGSPTGIAITPGATYGGFGGASNPAGSRLVVTDKYDCEIYIFDATTLAQIPASPIGNHCADVGGTLSVDDISSVEGAAIDAAGHIYVADYDRNRVTVYDSNGTLLGALGEPPASGPVPASALLGPSDVVIDHRGRLIVSDSSNQRLAVYSMDFSSGAVGTLLFSLNAAGDLNGYPSGVSEDTSHDPVGKLVVTDSGNNRVQRFQVPDLAVIQAQANGATQSVTFNVAVPTGKDPVGVTAVTPIVCPTSVGTTVVTGTLAPQSGCATAHSLIPTATVLPGQSVPYTFQFSSSATTSTFDIFATGNPDPHNGNAPATLSNHAQVTVTLTCATCTISPQVVLPGGALQAMTPPAGSSVLYTGSHIYTTAVAVRLTAASSIGLSEIDYQFISGPQSGTNGYPGLHTVAVSGATASTDVQFTLDGTSTVEYWARNTDGTQIAHGQAQLTLDLFPPDIAYKFGLATQPNAAGWWKAPFSVPFDFGNAHVTGIVPANATVGSPLVFTAEGRNIVFTVTVADAAGLTATRASNDPGAAGRTVNVDMTAPTFGANPTLTLERASYDGAPVPASLLSLATDPNLTTGAAGSGVSTVALVGALTNFSFGSSTQSFTATDVAGNSRTQNVTVNVTDTVKPVLTCPAAVSIAPGALGTLFNLPGFSVTDASMINAPTGVTPVVVTQSSLATLALVVNQVLSVTLTATDPSGNKGTCVTTVSAKLGGPPHFTRVPPAQTVEGSATATFDLNATAVDAAGTTLTVTAVNAAGATVPVSATPIHVNFPVGSTTVTFTAKDAANQTITATTVITVTDTTKPLIAACAAPVTLTTPATTPVAIPNLVGGVSASDYSTFSVTQSPAIGTLYTLPSGLSTLAVTVTLTVTDSSPAHNASTCQTVVTINKAVQPPVVTQSNLTATATSTTGATVTFAPMVVDAIDGTNHNAVTCTPASGSKFPVGTTTVTCSATDSAGLTGSVTFTVTVAHTAPVCTAAVASPSVLWPPNHQLVTIALTGVTTADGGPITTTVTSVFQDEPTMGLGDGDTAIDAYITSGVAQLRSERSGTGDGRVYYVGFTATTSGGSCTGTVTVGVPHDQAHPAVGGGAKYDSTKANSGYGDNCHGSNGHGHHDGDGCVSGHHGHYAGDNCDGKSGGYHHDGDGCIQGHHGHYDGDNCQARSGYHHDGDGDHGEWNRGGWHR